MSGITPGSAGEPSWPLEPTRKASGRKIRSRYVILQMPRGRGQRRLGRMNDTDCRVLAVGVGPTGLVLAAELLTRGIGTCNIDKGRDNK